VNALLMFPSPSSRLYNASLETARDLREAGVRVSFIESQVGTNRSLLHLRDILSKKVQGGGDIHVHAYELIPGCDVTRHIKGLSLLIDLSNDPIDPYQGSSFERSGDGSTVFHGVNGVNGGSDAPCPLSIRQAAVAFNLPMLLNRYQAMLLARGLVERAARPLGATPGDFATWSYDDYVNHLVAPENRNSAKRRPSSPRQPGPRADPEL